jgi:hypothetical protein
VPRCPKLDSLPTVYAPPHSSVGPANRLQPNFSPIFRLPYFGSPSPTLPLATGRGRPHLLSCGTSDWFADASLAGSNASTTAFNTISAAAARGNFPLALCRRRCSLISTCSRFQCCSSEAFGASSRFRTMRRIRSFRSRLLDSAKARDMWHPTGPGRHGRNRPGGRASHVGLLERMDPVGIGSSADGSSIGTVARRGFNSGQLAVLLCFGICHSYRNP